MVPNTTYYPTVTGPNVTIAATGSGGTASTANGVLIFTAGTSSPPTITSLSPVSTTAGGPQFTLTVNGTNYDSTCAVTWNSTGLTTTYVGSTQCTAVVPNTLIATAGSATVTISTTSGGTSNGSTFTIVAAAYIPAALTGGIVKGGVVR